jgi:indole-3-glycerol phosphate synthase
MNIHTVYENGESLEPKCKREQKSVSESGLFKSKYVHHYQNLTDAAFYLLVYSAYSND